MTKYLVTRVRHVLEGITVEAKDKDEAVQKSRKTLRKDWSHLDSKRRRGYRAEGVDTK